MLLTQIASLRGLFCLWDNSLLYKKVLDESLSFWCCHALVYEVDFMQEPFISTWDKVVSGIK